MFATPAFAQALGGAPAGGPQDMLITFLPFIVIIGGGYFLLARPQQQRLKRHQQMVAGLKRGDTVVLSSGIIGKVTRVDETEVQVDLAPGVNVKVVRTMISEVRTRGEPVPANDAKS